jgi:pheromone shutdown protein TraB
MLIQKQMMFKKILFFILAFSSISVFSQETKHDALNVKPTIYLVGSAHHMHFKPENNYTVNDLLEQIRKLKPDLVCGEIAPEAFDQLMEGYFPPEAAFLAEMANELNYHFIPVDWRLDYTTQFSIANNNFPDSVQELRTALLNNLQAKLKALNCLSLYDAFHQKAIIKDLDSLYEKIIRPNALAEIASGSWHERNRRITENGLMAAENAHTIVFVFGLDHLPGLQRELKSLGFEAQIPMRLFEPSNNFKVSKAVLDRWKRNLENLKLIRDKKISTTYDNYQKVINCNRIKDIEDAIQKSQ